MLILARPSVTSVAPFPQAKAAVGSTCSYPGAFSLPYPCPVLGA